MSARQALILLMTKNQMLRLTTPNARTRQSPWGKRAAGVACLRSGYALPPSDDPGHSHPDCRSLLTLIVAQHRPDDAAVHTPRACMDIRWPGPNRRGAL